jgi:hypothetical protein
LEKLMFMANPDKLSTTNAVRQKED